MKTEDGTLCNPFCECGHRWRDHYDASVCLDNDCMCNWYEKSEIYQPILQVYPGRLIRVDVSLGWYTAICV